MTLTRLLNRLTTIWVIQTTGLLSTTVSFRPTTTRTQLRWRSIWPNPQFRTLVSEKSPTSRMFSVVNDIWYYAYGDTHKDCASPYKSWPEPNQDNPAVRFLLLRLIDTSLIFYTYLSPSISSPPSIPSISDWSVLHWSWSKHCAAKPFLKSSLWLPPKQYIDKYR